MKKLLLIGGLTAILLAGCNNDNGTYHRDTLVDVGDLGVGYDLMRDTDTGCVYIMDTYNEILTPYYNIDGEVDGCGNESYQGRD